MGQNAVQLNLFAHFGGGTDEIRGVSHIEKPRGERIKR
jgi:hypothetical protein